MFTYFMEQLKALVHDQRGDTTVTQVIGAAIALFVVVLLVGVSMTLLTGTSTTGWQAGLISLVFNLPMFLAIAGAIGILVTVVVIARRTGGG